MKPGTHLLPLISGLSSGRRCLSSSKCIALDEKRQEAHRGGIELLFSLSSLHIPPPMQNHEPTLNSCKFITWRGEPHRHHCFVIFSIFLSNGLLGLWAFPIMLTVPSVSIRPCMWDPPFTPVDAKSQCLIRPLWSHSSFLVDLVSRRICDGLVRMSLLGSLAHPPPQIKPHELSYWCFCSGEDVQLFSWTFWSMLPGKACHRVFGLLPLHRPTLPFCSRQSPEGPFT